MASTAYISDFFVQTYNYREYLKQSVLRDLRTKYKRSVLGYVWTMLHPLGMMIVLYAVFTNVVRIPIENYAVFLFAGMLPWNFFQSTAMMSLSSIRANANLFGQVPVPKYIFVLSLTFSNLANFLLALLPLLLIMLVSGVTITPAILAFPIVLIPLLCTVTAVSLLFATSNVFFDDTLHLSEVFLQALYFLCPILYSREFLPEKLLSFLVVNPLFCQIEFIRGIFYAGEFPDPVLFSISLASSLVLLAASLWVFKKNEDKFMYFI